MNGYRLKCDMGLGDIVVQILIWVVLSVVTFGIAAFFAPYYVARLPINRTVVLDMQGQPIGRLRVDFGFGDIIGHMLIWILLTILTLGLAYIVYFYYVFRRLMNATRIEPSAGG
ncbi:DUF6693 family protein [Paracoccus sp. (in: a-proteobacteria)]|uniref:DUF6693 family protein n=1 Tax=Paracoccus sp. TaxID=267 RepID=UPI0026DEFA16|nr:DUF6693 family protein [Paracoccus sp. (in: a-proteobacteria)]MDO5647287.1 hypothetical protein [Paracoccus sp. (in: a-proteobacteria)]